jgi:hypothetical protein
VKVTAPVRVTIVAVAVGLIGGAAALAGNADLLSKAFGNVGIIVAVVCVAIAGAGPSFLSAFGVQVTPAQPYPGTSSVLHVPDTADVPDDLTPSDRRVHIDTDEPSTQRGHA